MFDAAHKILKQGTADLHRETEERLNVRGLLQGTDTVDTYRLLLATHHTVSHAFLSATKAGEPSIFDQHTEVIVNFTKGLDKDLKLLDLSFPAVEHPVFTPGKEAIAGTLYVLLGASRGASMILPRLKKAPGLAALSAFNYFERAAGFPHEQWNNFLAVINEELLSEAAKAAALKSARQTFKSFVVVHTLLEDASDFRKVSVKT